MQVHFHRSCGPKPVSRPSRRLFVSSKLAQQVLVFPQSFTGHIRARTRCVVSDDDSVICLRASRFNHSCSPNARILFNSNTGELRIYALGTIPRGEEIFVPYISNRCLYGKPRRSRQAILRARYHFTCACSVCSLPEAESKMSDARRLKTYRTLADHEFGEDSPAICGGSQTVFRRLNPKSFHWLDADHPRGLLRFEYNP